MADCHHMTTAEYAAHRGVSDSYIRRLRRKGLAVECAHGQIDVALTDAELGGALNPVRGGDRTPGAEPEATAAAIPHTALQVAGDVVSAAEAVRRGHLARARREELELGELAGDLTRVKDVRRTVITLVRQAVADMRLMSSKLRTTLAATDDPRKCEALIDAEISQICADMQRKAVALQEEWSGNRGGQA